MPEIAYIGKELELFKHAVVWKKYYGKILKPYIKGNVLEVGAGNGSTTGNLCNESFLYWICLEPDLTLFENLRQKIEAKELPSCCYAVNGIISHLQKDIKFDTILYIDVIEHIENASAELEQAKELLADDGYLIVLVPAHQFLYSAFDKAIGHYRRYNKKSLLAEIPSRLRLQRLFYLDSIGQLASLANKFFLRQDYPTQRQINFWDSVIVPISKVTDRVTNYSLGKTLTGIWKKVK
jgi:SAM-dependent methyltransferase